MTVDLATFCRAPFADLADLEPGTVAVVGVRDVHVGRSSRPASHAIRRASIAAFDDLAAAERLVDVDTGRTRERTTRFVDLGDVGTGGSLVDPLVESVVLAGAVPVVLGQEQSLTQTGLKGFCNASVTRGERVGLVCLSPDLDILFGVEPPSRHDQTVAIPVRLGPIDSTKTAVLGLHGFVPRRFWRQTSELGVTVVRNSDIMRAGVEAAARDALAAATTGTDVVFVAVDLGVLDLGHAPGRIGTRIGGLEASVLLDLCGALSSATIAGVALWGLAADLDATNRSAALAAQIVMELVAPPASSERTPSTRSVSHATG
jgi:arginase family enzyme